MSRPATPPRSLSPDTYERLLAAGAVAMLAAVVVAVVRGRAHWGEAPWVVWLHLITIGVALGLTPVLLLRVRGNRMHRLLGSVWAGAMLATAAISFAIRRPDGGLGAIHALSAVVLVTVPLLVLSARRHRVARHRRIVRGLVTGALLIAGFFTFPFGRMLGGWLFG